MAGADYTVVLNPDETVDSQTVVKVLAQFSIENRRMRGTNSAALASVCTEARLAELDAANIPTDLSTIAGYIDTEIGQIITAVGTTLNDHLLDIKGTAFVKDTHSLPQCLTAAGFSTHNAAAVWASVSRTLTANTNLNDPSANAIADTVLSRAVSNVEATADKHSLAAVIMITTNSSISGTDLTAKKPSDDTLFNTYTLVVDATADPITGVS